MGQKCGQTCLCVGVLTLGFGILTPTLFHILMKAEMRKFLPIVNGSFVYEKWQDLPVPMSLQLWVFDVVNAQEVMDNGDKPCVVERGPYTYRLRKEKVNITFNSNMTVTYRQLTWYHFDRNLSVGDENDTFTTINNILLGAAYMTRFQYPIIKTMVKDFLDIFGGNLYETHTVRDIAWGYEDPLLKMVKDDVLGLFNLSYLLDDHFGFFYKWNGSDDGLFTVHTGEQDLTTLNKVNRFNGLSYSPFWSTPEARMINGTDGTFFPPFLDKTKPLYFYSSDACRTFSMEFQKHKTVKNVDTYRYILPKSMLESGKVNPNNVGFCTPDITHCMPSGVLNVSSCREASSSVISYPHFLGADPEVINGVEGLHPDSAQHTTYLDFEPTLATPMDVAVRLQISVYVSKFANISQLRNTRTYFHPILWFNESTMITDELAEQLRSGPLLALHIATVTHYLLLCLGALNCVLAVVYIARKQNKKKRTKHVDNETSPLIQGERKTGENA